MRSATWNSSVSSQRRPGSVSWCFSRWIVSWMGVSGRMGWKPRMVLPPFTEILEGMGGGYFGMGGGS